MDISHLETNSSHETSFNKNLPLAKLHKFVAINDTVGFVKDTCTETIEEVLREFETITTTRFCSYYAKCFVSYNNRLPLPPPSDINQDIGPVM